MMFSIKNTISSDSCKLVNFLANKITIKKTINTQKNEVLKAHRYLLNNIGNVINVCKRKVVTPFDLFSKDTFIINQFKLSTIQPSNFLDKISHVGNWQTFQNPFQAFIQSLSATKKTTGESIQAVSDRSAISSNQVLNSSFSAEVLKIIKENPAFITVRIQRPAGWNFQPGQYVEIRAEGLSEKKPAILAIASGIHADYIEITAKPNPNLNHPHYFFNHLTAGDQVTVNGPLGSYFPLDLVTSETPVFLLGGGSGLTALRSLLESMPSSTRTKLIYSTKVYNDVIYKDELDYLNSKGHIISFTQDKVAGFAEGRITHHIKIEELKSGAMFFLCGPKQLVLEMAQLLVEKGVPRELIYGSLPVTAEEGGPVFRGDHPKMMT